MLVLDCLGQRLEPGHLSIGFLGTAGLLGLSGVVALASAGPGLGVWRDWLADMLGRPEVLRSLVCQVILPTVLGFHWMNTYQPLVSPTRAALIYLLEPVFTAVFSVWVGHDKLTWPLIYGGTLILAGNVLVELPRWLPLWRRGQLVTAPKKEG
jgi:drug/metabolite transporter (DMT)-like permease